MPTLRTPSRLIAASVIATMAAGGVAAALAAPKQARRVNTANAAAARVDSLAREARQRWSIEASGSVVHSTLRHVAADPTLRRTLQSGNTTALRDYVGRQFQSVWYHWHVSRLRILRGGQVLVDTGVPFVVAPAQQTMRGTNGHVIGTLEISIQDVIGYVRYLHRNAGIDVVVRGRGAGHVRSSLPAATNASLPRSGSVTLGGTRYAVRSFARTGLAGEPVTVWVLVKG
jgi:hypothetical protein